MNVLSPMQAANTSPSRYGMDAAAATPTRHLSFFCCLHHAVNRSRMGSLFIVGLLVTICSGCTHWGRVSESSQREVFGFTFDDSSGNNYYEAGLVISKLFDRETFHILLKDLPTTRAMPSSSDIPTLPNACFDPKDTIRIEPGSMPNTVTVRADFRSPFAYPKKGVRQNEGMSQWIATCHCSTPEDEIRGQCFSDRLVNSIDSKLANTDTSKSPGGLVTTLTHEAHQRIAREAGMPFGAFDILAQRERGLTKHGNASHYFGQLLNPGEFLCFDSATYSPTWHDKITQIVSTSEPGEPACLPWDTLLRSRYREGSADLLSTGIDPLSRWANSWKEDTIVTVGGISRDGDRIINTPDAISRSLEGPFRYVLVFAKNEEFTIPFGPERDLNVTNSVNDPGMTSRGSFILLIRDARLMNYLREQFQEKDTCKVISGENVSFNGEPHRYLDCLAHEWGKNVGIDVPENDKNWMLDVIVPSNVRPYVAFDVTVDDHPVRVRAGSTLLNLIDRRLGLSALIIDLRSGSTATSETPVAHENELIRNASGRVNYERRAGFELIPVGLCNAVRLEDLLIPLKPGDRVTWHD